MMMLVMMSLHNLFTLSLPAYNVPASQILPSEDTSSRRCLHGLLLGPFFWGNSVSLFGDRAYAITRKWTVGRLVAKPASKFTPNGVRRLAQK